MTAPRRFATATAVTATCIAIATVIGSCDRDNDTPIPDEAMRAGRGWETLTPAADDYFADMDRGMSRPSGSGARRGAIPEDAGEGGRHLRQGAEQLDRLDGRQRHALELPVEPHLRRARLPEDAVDARRARVRPRQGRVRPLEVSRAGQRAVLRAGHGAGPDAIRPVAGQAPVGARLSARSVRGRAEISRYSHRRARARA